MLLLCCYALCLEHNARPSLSGGSHTRGLETRVLGTWGCQGRIRCEESTPSPPTQSFPTKSPRVEISCRLPIRLYGHEDSHPLELRVCLSQTL